MKRFFLFAAALVGLLAVSCNKEKDMPVAIDRVAGPTHTVSFKATIAPETRTSYADDKTFSWKEKDSVIVLTLSPDEQYIRLTTFYAESAGTETIFSGEVEEGYTLYNLAFYTAAGSGVAFGGEDDSNIYFYLPSGTYIDGDSKTDYTVESANPLANLPLIGQQQEDNSYRFYTATGAAKFTFTDVPEGAAYFVVEMSDEPLSGYFTWNENGIITNDSAREGTYTYTGSDGQEHTARYANRFVFYHFERSADGTGTVYMPLPVGRIPAGARIAFYDEDMETILYSRPVRSDIPIDRNKVTEVAPFSASHAWESMGIGAYYDLPVFYYMTPEADRETDDILGQMSQVEFFQDVNMPGVYRFENPYKKAAEDRGYTIDEEYAKDMDDYLVMTILKNGSVVYDDYYTGYKYSSSTGGTTADVHPFAACPSNWGDDNSFNFVAKYNEAGVPTNAFLSSLYLYERDGGVYYWNWPDSWSYMWTTVLFPDATEQLDLNCSVSMAEMVDDTPAHPTAKVDVKIGEDLTGAYLVIAPDKATAEEMIAAGKATLADGTGNFTAPFPEDAPSGVYYAFAKTVPAEGLTENCALLFQAEEEYEYFRTDMDRQLTMADIVGTYTTEEYYFTLKQYKVTGYGWTPAPKTLTMVIEESDNPLSGDIMFTDICPELVKAITGAKSPTPSPVYGWFDTATGVITIDTGQPAYTVGKNYYTVGNIDGEAVGLYLKEPGVVFCKKNIAFLLNGALDADYEVPEGWTNAEATFTRSGSSSAPAAKAPAQTTRSSAGHSAPSLQNPFSARRPVEEAIPFLGQREPKPTR